MLIMASRLNYVVVPSVLTLAVGDSVPEDAQGCGNGCVEAGEECDDGFESSNTGARSTMLS
jgi:cysteine-rich repeat protein